MLRNLSLIVPTVFFLIQLGMLSSSQALAAPDVNCDALNTNDDRVIDITDINELSFRAGSREGDFLYKSEYDLDSDGDIDADDVRLANGCLGHTVGGPPTDTAGGAINIKDFVPFSSFGELVTSIITFALAAAGLVFFAMLIIGGFRYLSAKCH